MKRTFPIAAIMLALALMTTATPALARTQRTAVAGTEHMIFGVPGSVETSGPWVLLHDLPLTGTFDFGTLKGDETQLVSARLDPLTGDGIVWGTVTYRDSAAGITCSGVRAGALDNYLVTARIFVACSDRSVLFGTLQDTAVVFPPGSPIPGEVTSEFNGVCLIR
jgi:hypothetical protein